MSPPRDNIAAGASVVYQSRPKSPRNARPNPVRAFVMFSHPATNGRAHQMNQQAIDRIAAALPNLQHPGIDGGAPFALPIAAFRTADLPQPVAEQFAAEAGFPHADIPKLVAEAIVAVLEADSEIVARNDLAALRASATPAARIQQIDLHCLCGVKLCGLAAHDANTSKPKVAGPEFIKAMRQLGTECATGHRP